MPKMKQSMAHATSQDTVEWYTPPWIVELARNTMGGIDLDPASNTLAQSWVKAGQYITINDPWSGLAIPWAGRVWLNPPFDDMTNWTRKFADEYHHGDVTQAMAIVNSAQGYDWYESLLDLFYACQLRKRVHFITEQGTPADGPHRKGQTIIYAGDNPERFIALWDQHGRIIPPTKPLVTRG